MKILAVADEESRYLWDHFSPDKLRGVDLILSCGDVSPQYLCVKLAPVPQRHGQMPHALRRLFIQAKTLARCGGRVHIHI